VPRRRLADDAFLRKLGQPAHRYHHVEVRLPEPRIDVQVIEANVRLARAQRSHAEARLAPPRVAPLALLIEGAVVIAEVDTVVNGPREKSPRIQHLYRKKLR